MKRFKKDHPLTKGGCIECITSDLKTDPCRHVCPCRNIRMAAYLEIKEKTRGTERYGYRLPFRTWHVTPSAGR